MTDRIRDEGPLLDDTRQQIDTLEHLTAIEKDAWAQWDSAQVAYSLMYSRLHAERFVEDSEGKRILVPIDTGVWTPERMQQEIELNKLADAASRAHAAAIAASEAVNKAGG